MIYHQTIKRYLNGYLRVRTLNCLLGLWDMKSVKTKSSTEWCSLFSIESKYSVVIELSNLQRKLVAAESTLILAAVFVVVLKYHQALPYSYLLVLLVAAPCYFLLIKYLPFQRYYQNFELDRFGVLRTANNQLYQLSTRSRVSWFGCLLVFEVTEKYPKAPSIFIYNDSICSQSLSRLKRTIYYQQKYGNAPKSELHKVLL